jgi:hypothetical protein
MEKIYCGNAKVVSTSFGDLTKISLSKDDINKMVGYMKSNKLDWINLVVKEKKNKVDGKPTHYLEVDTWKPEAKEIPPEQPMEDKDDLPF